MDDKIYKITLSDETVLDNLRLNGNGFISSSEIDESVFDGNCSIVTINNGEKGEVHMNMELVQVTKVSDKHWFVLRGIPEAKMAFAKMQSDIEYVVMMSEIELQKKGTAMGHSKNCGGIKRYYNLGVWNEIQVRSAVGKNQITEEEFKEITGKDYA